MSTPSDDLPLKLCPLEVGSVDGFEIIESGIRLKFKLMFPTELKGLKYSQQLPIYGLPQNQTQARAHTNPQEQGPKLVGNSTEAVQLQTNVFYIDRRRSQTQDLQPGPTDPVA